MADDLRSFIKYIIEMSEIVSILTLLT